MRGKEKNEIDKLLQAGASWHQRVRQDRKRIQVLADGRVPDKEAKNWRIEGQKRRITRKEYRRLLNKFQMEGFMAQKGLWNLARKSVLQDRGALPEEEGDVIGEF